MQFFFSLNAQNYKTFSFFFGGRGVQETLGDLAGFMSSRETISQLGVEPPSTFGLGTSPLSPVV